MAKAKKSAPIHLSNKTASALRKTAQRVRGAWLIAMGVFAMLAVVLAVYLGFSWLPAVPLTLLAAGVVVMVMMIIARSQYLLLLSQAICTEEAARSMQERESETQRRRKAIEQIAEIRADVREAQKNGLSDGSEGSEAALLFDLLTGWDRGEEEKRRGKDEEDDELYGADYSEESYGMTDEDLRPPKPAKKKSAAPTVSAPKEKPVVAAASATLQPEKDADETEEETQAPRRRRRSTPAQTTPLTLLRSDQAQ